MSTTTPPGTAPQPDHDPGQKPLRCAACKHDLTGLVGSPGAAPQGTQCPACGVDLARDAAVEPTPGLLKELGATTYLGVAALLFPLLGSIAMFATLTRTGPWLREQALAGQAIFAAVFLTFTGLALLPTYAMAGAGGWIFGLPVGASLAVGSIVGGSFIGYLIGRGAAADRLEAALESRPKWQAVREALAGHRDPQTGRLLGAGYLRTLGIITLIRVPPNSPFALTNFVLAACRVPLSAYLIGTAVGIAPRTIVAAWIGSGIGAAFSADSLKAQRPDWVFWGGLGVSLVVVVIIGKIATQAMERFTSSHSGTGRSPGAPGGDRDEPPLAPQA